MFIKSLIAGLALLCASLSFAAVDVNKANAAELDSIKGIGPSMSAKILEARKSGDFKDWADLSARVKGIKEGNAAKFSAGGLTVGGSSFQTGTVSAATPKPTKAAAATPAVAASAPASAAKK